MCARPTLHHSWGPIILGVGLFAALGTFLYMAVRPAVPIRKLHQVRVGMTQNQVHEILGRPRHARGRVWEYWRWGNAGYVQVTFDESHRVQVVNDESVFLNP